jgi:hypothetical protein
MKDDDIVKLSEDIDNLLITITEKYGLSPLSLIAVVLARLTIVAEFSNIEDVYSKMLDLAKDTLANKKLLDKYPETDKILH